MLVYLFLSNICEDDVLLFSSFEKGKKLINVQHFVHFRYHIQFMYNDDSNGLTERKKNGLDCEKWTIACCLSSSINSVTGACKSEFYV